LSTASQWKTLEGGLAMFLATDSRINIETPPSMDQAAVFVKTIFQNVTRFGVGFDLDAASDQSGLRFEMRCRDVESAERIKAIVATMLPLAKTQLQAMIQHQPEIGLDNAEREKSNLNADGPDTGREVGQFLMNVLNSCTTEIDTHDDGTVHLRVTTTAPFPAQIMSAF
jgi:hypothetical protein